MTKVLKKPVVKPSAVSKAQTAPAASVLVRVCNQMHLITSFVDRLLSAPLKPSLEVVIVDDGSTDGTGELLAELSRTRPAFKYLRQERTLGAAECLRAGCGLSTGEIVVLLDLERGVTPWDLPTLLRPLVEDTADVVQGSRYMPREYRPVSWNRQTLIARVATGVSNFLNGVAQSDIRPHGIALRKELLENIPLLETGGELETELTVKLAKCGVRIVEAPVTADASAEASPFGIGELCRQVGTVLKYRYWKRQFTLHDGFNILVSVGNASKFNRWMVSKLSPFFGKRILEAGSGIGNLTELLTNTERLVCVDRDPFYVDRLRQRFGHLSNLSFHELDLNDLGKCKAVRAEGVDTIVCVNVLEHIEDDRGVLKSFADLLPPGGQVVLLVPADPRLYSEVDRTLGHYRRYTFAEATEKMQAAGLEVVHCSGFNRLGAIGWFVSGQLLRRSTLSSRQMKVYELLLPVAKLLERLPFVPHLSVIAVGRKPKA